MVPNFRLRPDEEAPHAGANRSGRCQQELLREALDHDLGTSSPGPEQWQHLITSGKVPPPREGYRKVVPTESLPPGWHTGDLLDREDRL